MSIRNIRARVYPANGTDPYNVFLPLNAENSVLVSLILKCGVGKMETTTIKASKGFHNPMYMCMLMNSKPDEFKENPHCPFVFGDVIVFMRNPFHKMNEDKMDEVLFDWGEVQRRIWSYDL